MPVDAEIVALRRQTVEAGRSGVLCTLGPSVPTRVLGSQEPVGRRTVYEGLGFSVESFADGSFRLTGLADVDPGEEPVWDAGT